MKMEDHNHHNHQYNIDLRQFISGRPTHFPPVIPQPPPPPPELFSTHRTNLPPQAHHHYDMMMLMPRGGGGVGGGLHDFHSDSTSTVAAAAAAAAVCAHPLPPSATTTTTANSANTTVVAGAATAATLSGLEGEGGGSFGGCDGGTGRWPRQETLTLLEIRSRLDSKFKEANQKGPLWDDVSRILYEEHGYQRSGKKCREKFENLYKYYKKTKEGKAGRQDGKHYRFFRQLEALYGETSNPSSIPDTQFVNNSLRFQTATTQETTFHSQKLCDSLSLSNNSSEFDTSSSEDNDLSTATLVENDSIEKRRKRKSWKAKIKDFIDSQMRKLIDRQEAWLEKLTKTLEEKEQERMLREEEWRKQEAARIDKEHKFWAKERAWIEARDAALMDALRNLSGKEVNISYLSGKEVNISSSPAEELMSGEIQTRSENEKCETNKESNKKRKENNNSRNCCYFQSNDHHQQHQHQSMYNPGGGYCDEINEHQQGQETENSNVGNAVSESCFRFLMSDGSENLWENYGLKLSKGESS